MPNSTSTTNPAADLKALCDRAEALAGKATPGPWWTEGWADGKTGNIELADVVDLHGTVTNEALPDDAEFIAASRTLVPQLAAALRDMEAAVDYALDVLDSEGYVKDARHVRGLLHSAAAAAVRHIEGDKE